MLVEYWSNHHYVGEKICIFQWFYSVGLEEVTVTCYAFHKNATANKKTKVIKTFTGWLPVCYWLEFISFLHVKVSMTASYWNYRICVCKYAQAVCFILEMNPCYRIHWNAISEQHACFRESQGGLPLVSFGPTFLAFCKRCPSLLQRQFL